MSGIMKEWSERWCKGCEHADEELVGTGEPCCELEGDVTCIDVHPDFT